MVMGRLDPPRNQVYTHDYFKIIPKVLVYTMIIPGILARQGWIICETIYTQDFGHIPFHDDVFLYMLGDLTPQKKTSCELYSAKKMLM